MSFVPELLDGAPLPVGTIYCVGRNYAKHAAELGNPVPVEPFGFLKARAALRGLDPSPVARPDLPMEHEVEVVVHVGAPVPLAGAAGWSAVDAVTVGIDLTRREVQNRCKEQGLPWTAAKSFAGSAIVAPFVPVATLGDPASIRFALEVEGVERQRGALADAILGVPEILGWLAGLAPLEVGDVVFTGTPAGVGPLAVGQAFALTLEASGGRWRFDGRL